MQIAKITKARIKKDGTLDQRGEFIGTFIKANGQVRTMHFGASRSKINGWIAEGKLATVFDCANKGLRKFNFAKLVGEVTAVN